MNCCLITKKCMQSHRLHLLYKALADYHGLPQKYAGSGLLVLIHICQDEYQPIGGATCGVVSRHMHLSMLR